jgi:ATP-dependent DNA ligase
VLVAFDLLYLNGYDLRKLPLTERKALLKKLIADTDVQFSQSFEVDGREMYAHACKVGLERVVSKVRDSQYPTGRSNAWLKKACQQRESGGFNVYAREVEDALHAHPSVEEVAVLGLPDAEWGEVIAAFVVRRPGQTSDADAKLDHQ